MLLIGKVADQEYSISVSPPLRKIDVLGLQKSQE
jgi:hypothetical protein